MAFLQATVLAKFIAEWWRGAKGHWGGLAELDRCGPDEVSRMAGDLSLTTWELRSLAGKPDSTDLLLYRRMADLGLDQAEVARTQPTLTRDMQKLCTMCQSKAQCQRDLLRCADPSSSWRAYCPNDETLHGLALW